MRMRVTEAHAGGPGRKRDATMTMHRNERRLFLCSLVHVHWDALTVPVQLLGRVGVVIEVHGDRLAFPQSQEGSGKLFVV